MSRQLLRLAQRTGADRLLARSGAVGVVSPAAAAALCWDRSYLRAGVLIGSASGAAPNEAAIRAGGGSR